MPQMAPNVDADLNLNASSVFARADYGFMVGEVTGKDFTVSVVDLRGDIVHNATVSHHAW